MDRFELIARPDYLQEIERHLGQGRIIVLTGQRRVGKSYMLKLVKERYQATSDCNVIYIDKEKREFDFIDDYRQLNQYIEEHIDRSRRNLILIDEIQDVEGFEKSVRSYRTDPGTDVIITGSNARMLSNELSTIIGGRYKEIYIQSLSYQEFLQFQSLEDSDQSLAQYIEFGGLPGLVKIGLNIDDAREYQSDIVNTVLLKDVILRNKIRNIPFLEKLLRFVADNSGKLFSPFAIEKFMKSQGVKVVSSVVSDYLNYLCEAFIIRKAERFDIHGKKLFESNEKYYFEDHGIRNSIAGGTREGDIEKVIETIIYNELVRRGFKVNVGQLKVGEIDFVGTKSNGERIYVQASYIIADEHTREREFGNLKAINDNYPKYVVSMTPLLVRNDEDGIIHINLRHFLTTPLYR